MEVKRRERKGKGSKGGRKGGRKEEAHASLFYIQDGGYHEK